MRQGACIWCKPTSDGHTCTPVRTQVGKLSVDLVEVVRHGRATPPKGVQLDTSGSPRLVRGGLLARWARSLRCPA